MSKTPIPTSLRERVLAQAGHRCGYCQSSSTITATSLEIDHLVPESRGGQTTEDNLWAACSDCNNAKKARLEAIDPETGTPVPLFNPRHQRWSDHFAWREGGMLIIGLTPTGRAAVQALKLNRPILVRARRLWISAGWHPPAKER